MANKVNVEIREVIEFNNKLAAQVYADALGIESDEDISKHFLNHPAGLIIDEGVLVRSPERKNGLNIKFCCNILKDMEVG